VSTDARRVRQVLDGLAENALRVLEPGQPLVLHVSHDPNGAVPNFAVPYGSASSAAVPYDAASNVAVPNRAASTAAVPRGVALTAAVPYGVAPSVPVPNGAVLQVRDGGPGLAAEDYPVAFEQGVLHDRYRTRRPGGAGLGLALAHSLVIRLGGTIIASPATEGGVAMTIWLPAGAPHGWPWTGRPTGPLPSEVPPGEGPHHV